MIPSLDLSVFVRLGDQITAPLRDAENTIAKASDRMNKRLALSMKLAGGGAAAAGIAFGAQRLVTNFTDSIREVERAKGELATLGVQDLDAVVRKGREMQFQLAGVTADAFVRASYDIKSGISSLTDQGVADMTAAAMVTAKATKGIPEQMTSLFATSYGIFKDQYAIMSDADFGNMFGAALSASVQQFKTDGAAMQQAIESAGAGAVNLGMDMTEQLALLGMMQQQMQAGEAGTALRAFATNAARAHENFAKMRVTAENPVRVRVLDENGQLRAMPDILADLEARYGDTLDAFEAAEIKEAFGTDEAMKMINALYGQEEAVRANAEALEDAAGQGAEFTRQMAAAADNNWDATMVLMAQRFDVIKQKLGTALLPVVQKLVPWIEAFMFKTIEWIDANPMLIAGIGAVVVGLGSLAAIVAPILMGVSALISTWGVMSFGLTKLAVTLFSTGSMVAKLGGTFVWLAKSALPLVAKGIFLIGKALIANPIGIAIMAIAGAAYLIYRYWEPISAFFSDMWAMVSGYFETGEQTVGSVIRNIGRFLLMLTPIGWASLIPRLFWRNYIGPIGWVKRAGALVWSTLIKPLTWARGLIGRIGWRGLAGGLRWSMLLTPLKWGARLIPGIGWAALAGQLLWSFLIKPLGWDQYIPTLSWDGFLGLFTWDNALTALDWASWLLPIRWLDFIPGFEWSSVISSALDWSAWLPAVSWGDVVGVFTWDNALTALDWASWLLPIAWLDFIPGFEWSSVIGALDLSAWMQFSWGDVLPDWDWSAIIPDLPDLKGLFNDAGESVDVRLENRATTTFGQWDEGIAMVDQYRQGLLDLQTMQDQLAAKVATEEGAWNWSYEVERAAEMLALLQEIEGARSNAEPQITNPETLLQAAQAATELETRFPAITTAANETLSAVQTVLAQITALIQGTDFTAEGARLAKSIADGMLGQLGAVRAAAAQIAATIRNALPSSARVNVNLAASAPAVQARARGGKFGPGWLLTGEEGPELEYRTEGGFIAHNRALRGMQDMAIRTRDIVAGIDVGGTGGAQVPAIDSVAASGAPGIRGGNTITLSPQYNMPMSFDGGVDMDEVRMTVRAEMMDAEERMAAELRGHLHD